MSTLESFAGSLNPEGESVVVDAAERMLEDLLEANHGRHTDISSARDLVVDAQAMCQALEDAQGAGPKTTDLLVQLGQAIEDLNDVMKQVH